MDVANSGNFLSPKLQIDGKGSLKTPLRKTSSLECEQLCLGTFSKIET